MISKGFYNLLNRIQVNHRNTDVDDFHTIFFLLRAQHTSIPSTKGTDRQYQDLLAFYRKNEPPIDDGTVNALNSTRKQKKPQFSLIIMVNKHILTFINISMLQETD